MLLIMLTIVKKDFKMKEKKTRQYRSRQGRSDKQYTNSLIVFAITFVGLILTIIITRWT